MVNVAKKKLLVAAIILLSTSLRATVVQYDAVQLSGSSWLYEYTIINDQAYDIKSISITFDADDFTNLTLSSSPSISAAWDEVFFNFSIESNIYDALAVGSNKIAAGETLSGFSVSFTYNGPASPDSQFFEIFDPDNNFESLETGWTVPVPEPLTLLILGGGLLSTRIKKR